MPPVHALPPSGPSVQITELFNSLHMNIPQILFRIQALFQLLYEPCHYCKRRLSEIDGYPLGRIGWLPYPPKPAAHEHPEKKGAEGEKTDEKKEGEKEEDKKDGEKAEANGEKKEDEKKDEGDVSMTDGEKKDEEKADDKKDDDQGKKDEEKKNKMEVDDEKKEDGRWICWHQSCLAQVR